MYRVIKYFTDLQDDKYPYNVGDVFPREGYEVTDERLDELAGENNKQGCPLIVLVEEDKEPDADAPAPVEEKEPAVKPARKAPARKTAASKK